ncbi:alkanesulfonate monooxygenase SsuD/methylene tetrahydromethanopterin reductase-like flavin-dependent oxidoreductase (luciferase family) [Thermocatellispora tengchongensis]|uniref:Alkanesulfonate monooxygenase SsuD/methylene tetrahydromethanopterin reductase-like flavin-dependent oxidoreductase (Luciferase family) n=1 Tax=Thermocatellispora tengchongensis TaxID=1073253 RepID=A0A840PFQ8_9ACTN|nr:LLM class flavin-dependent oxidoreductase [Thermocatellispora tengchongensis]MBB5136300.1 alkanesulfonate monooxygenase SsuD/methylene tetrahydromethanopterin reductase-like flavin-dependent oxidoreductase (luciferase family) [Thermocatellispora tengchongensis]
MGDYGRALEFGYFLVPAAGDPLLERARLADDLGLDLIGVQDHPYQRRYVDTWTLLTMIAAVTGRIRVFPDVVSLPLRPPAVLAKSAASLSLLSGGRVELGLGAGAFWEAIEAYGGARRTPAQALAALDEAITVIRKVWSGERNLRFEGEHYRLAGAHSGPVPPRPIELWLGVGGPRALALAGARADGWLPSSTWATPERLPELIARLDEGAVAAGRDPRDVRRLYNVNGAITEPGGPSAGFLNGPPEQWADELTDLALGYGLDTFVLWPEGDQERQLRRFAEEVVPEVRERVAKEREG